MGQLEKYGLYVLCLVIFLILGVAIWGEPVAAQGRVTTSVGQQPVVGQSQNMGGSAASNLGDLQALMRPATRPGSAPQLPRSAEPADRDRSTQPESTVGSDGARSSEGSSTVAANVAPAPAAGAATLEATQRTYVIRSGDTLSEIAQDQLGSMRFAPLLLQLNPGIRADRLPLGKKLRLPNVTQLSAVSGPVKGIKAGSVTYRIKRGDTLEGLAKTRLGSAGRVKDIKKLNPTVDPTRLRIGQILYLPAQ